MIQGPTNGWSELDYERNAAEWSDLLMAEHAAHRAQDPDWQPPCTTTDEEEAYMDAMKAMAGNNLPDPTHYAFSLQAVQYDCALSLIRAQRVEIKPGVHRYRVPASDPNIKLLERLGIIALGDRTLGQWAYHVRQALMSDDDG